MSFADFREVSGTCGHLGAQNAGANAPADRRKTGVAVPWHDGWVRRSHSSRNLYFGRALAPSSPAQTDPTKSGKRPRKGRRRSAVAQSFNFDSRDVMAGFAGAVGSSSSHGRGLLLQLKEPAAEDFRGWFDGRSSRPMQGQPQGRKARTSRIRNDSEFLDTECVLRTLRKCLAPVGIVQVGTQNRSSEYNRQVREIVRSGGLGPIGLVKACNKGMIRFGRATRAPRRRGSIGTVGGFALRGTR